VPPPGQQPIPGQPYNPFANQTAGQPYNPFQQNTGQAPLPGQPNVQAGGSQPPGAAGQPNQAVGLIQQILTTPRQPPASVAGLTGGGAGIAGVASTAEGKGIHVVRDRSKYKEWEFIYTMRTDSTGQPILPQQLPPGASPQQQPQQQQQSQAGR
jgi:hypothetical protein